MTARTPELTAALSRVNEEEVGRSGADAPPLCRPSGGAAKASPAEPAVANADHALPFRRCTSADLFTLKSEPPEGFIEDSDAYLSAFVAPTVNEDGKRACFHCGTVMDAFMQAFGIGAAYEWGLAHGEARCSKCRWPARGMHYPKGRDGEELYSLSNFFLAYHPDEVTVSGGEQP